MKKIMIALAVVAMAAFAQAATVKWSSGVFSGGFAGPDGVTMKGATGYTMTVMVYSDALGETLIDTTTSTAANNGGAFVGTMGFDFDTSKTYYVKAVITDGAMERTADLAAFQASATGTSTLNFFSGANFVETGAKWGEWHAVPEPTSGLLLLLGMAGLALRRKQA